MKNAEAIRRRLDEIKKMSSYTEALIALSDVTFDIGMEACSERAQLRKDVEAMRKVIEGNGDPSHSVVHRLASVESAVDEVAENVQKILDKLVGTLEKGGTIARCNERFEKLEELHKDIKKVGWYVVFAWLGIIINALVSLFGG
jgi:DNA-binding FrmR family transcriptional regulator